MSGADILNVSYENETARSNDSGQGSLSSLDSRQTSSKNEGGQVQFSDKISKLWFDGNIDDGREQDHHAETKIQHLRHEIRPYIDSLKWRIITVVLILIDIIIMIVDLSTPNKSDSAVAAYDAIALTFSCVFVIDVGLRIFSYGAKKFFSIKYEVLDFSIVVITFTVTVLYTAIDNSGLKQYGTLVSVARGIRVVRVVRIVYSHQQMKKSGRRMVSQNKRRYKKDGFDLDLTYVTPRVIAMSFPSSGAQSLYRNPIDEVARFFKTKHPGQFRIYNLCSERGYDETKFNNKVYRVMIDDHNVPTIKDLEKFIVDANQWMGSSESNIVAIHCKGGKGRTGTIVCSWLLEIGMFQESKAALEYFGKRRTDLEVGETFQGVETASQIRYVGYYEQMKKLYNGGQPNEQELQIREVTITSIRGVGGGDGRDLTMVIIMEKKVVATYNFSDSSTSNLRHDKAGNSIVIELANCPVLRDDIKIMFHSTDKSLPKGYDDCPFYFWFNTRFVRDEQLVLTRAELDNPHKPKTWHIFQEDFSIWLTMRKSL